MTHRPWITIALAVLTLLAGALPAAVAYVGALIVDSVVAAARTYATAGAEVYRPVLQFVALEALIVAGIAAAQRAISLCQSLLRALLGQRVNVMILEKALTLELRQDGANTGTLATQSAGTAASDAARQRALQSFMYA